MDKIRPCLWFNAQTEAALALYTSVFDNAKVTTLSRIPAGPAKGNVLAEFTLEDQDFMAFDAGSPYRFTPGISFFASCPSVEVLDARWAKLAEGGTVMMDIGEYPFSPRFGWLADKFGISWQLSAVPRGQQIAPFFLFVGNQYGKAEEAIAFYTSLFAASAVRSIVRYAAGEGESEGAVKHAIFTLSGREFMASESGLDHPFTFTPATSLHITCDNQEEVDRLWRTFAEGGEEQQCGWVIDRFGVAWQVQPRILGELLKDPDPAKCTRVVQAMLQMVKMDVEGLKKAYAGD